MSASWTSPALEAIGRLIRARTGLLFEPNRVADAEAGIRRAMEKARLGDDVGSYLGRLQAGKADLDELVAELTVSETYFFREPAHFEFIRRQILPALVGTPSSDAIVRVWSAGCASGEEAYSLAIVLEEAGLGERAHVLATDISHRALVRAREASYGAWSFRGVDLTVVERYFRAAGDRKVLDARIRERVRIEALNLARDVYPTLANGTWRQDLILCRNVLIYFDRETVRRVARRLCESLSPTGWLITGSSDPSINEEGLFEAVVTHGGVFYRRARAAPTELGPPAPAVDPIAVEPPLAMTGAALAEPSDPLAGARSAFERGDYGAAAELAQRVADPGAAALSIRALANARGARAAEKAARDASARYPMAAEIHLLRAVLLLEMSRYEDAARAAKNALYVDRTLAFGHFLHGMALARLRDAEGARRALFSAGELCARQRPDEAVAFSDGQPAERLAEAVRAQLDVLAGATSS